MSAKPIQPSEVASKKLTLLPDGVIESFNELIAEKMNNGRAVVLTKDVVGRIMSKIEGVDRNTVYDNGWLNVEGIYREAGWTVKYDRPDYTENYDAYFTFDMKR